LSKRLSSATVWYTLLRASAVLAFGYNRCFVIIPEFPVETCDHRPDWLCN